jgi:NTE family protein
MDPSITLKDLYKLTKKKVIFTTVCVNKQEVCYLSHETCPYLPLCVALRMSISIPLYFTPVRYNVAHLNKSNNNFITTTELYIDGGCIDNYPIQLFDHQLDDVLGIFLVNKKNYVENIEGLDRYLLMIFDCFMQGLTFNAIKGYNKYTVSIDLDSIGLVDFNIDISIKKQIFLKGFDTIKNKFVN